MSNPEGTPASAFGRWIKLYDEAGQPCAGNDDIRLIEKHFIVSILSVHFEALIGGRFLVRAVQSIEFERLHFFLQCKRLSLLFLILPEMPLREID